MMLYVLGFAQAPDGRIALIKKARPESQAGKYNGIGGKVEQDEMPDQAMVREFEEETGVKIPLELWSYRGAMIGPDWQVDVYWVESPLVDRCRTVTDEAVGIFNDQERQSIPLMPNIETLISACRMAESPAPTFLLDYNP